MLSDIADYLVEQFGAEVAEEIVLNHQMYLRAYNEFQKHLVHESDLFDAIRSGAVFLGIHRGMWAVLRIENGFVIPQELMSRRRVVFLFADKLSKSQNALIGTSRCGGLVLIRQHGANVIERPKGHCDG